MFSCHQTGDAPPLAAWCRPPMTEARLLDLFAMGVVTVDAAGRVRELNKKARRVLERGEGIALANGRLVPARREDAAALARLLGDGCPHAVIGGAHVRGAMQIVRPGRPKLTLAVAVVHGMLDAAGSYFVLFLHAPDAEVVVSEGSLRMLHNLTRMEARITALLVRGDGVGAIAGQTGRSANTVRTHLKRVFGKLGVASQSALMRVVLTGPAALWFDGEDHRSHPEKNDRRSRQGAGLGSP